MLRRCGTGAGSIHAARRSAGGPLFGPFAGQPRACMLRVNVVAFARPHYNPAALGRVWMGPASKHLLGIERMSVSEILQVLDLAETYVELNRRQIKRSTVLAGMTQINMFFENSTRTQASFELAGKRLGADVMNLEVRSSSVGKGETLIDTAMTLNAMRPDLLVVRHPQSGAVNLLADKVNCAVVNAGDGRHEHPTQALLDALTIRRAKGALHGLTVAICGDIQHSRVARSNFLLLSKLQNPRPHDWTAHAGSAGFRGVWRRIVR